MANKDGKGARPVAVAVIGALGLVIAALITSPWWYPKNTESPSRCPGQQIPYGGRVMDKQSDALIKSAAVFIDTRGETQKYFTDSNGIYQVCLSPDIKSVHLRVEADSYKTVDTYISPKSRDQLEDIRLVHPSAFGINLPEGMKLKAAIEFLAEQDKFGVQFIGKCDPRLLQAQVNGGEYDGNDAGDVIEQLKGRLVSLPGQATYRVTRIPERKVYQIECSN